MMRSLKALLVSGAIVASLVGSATPASAANCVGIYMNQGLKNAGYWDCDSCPDSPHYGPLDGTFWVIVCF